MDRDNIEAVRELDHDLFGEAYMTEDGQRLEPNRVIISGVDVTDDGVETEMPCSVCGGVVWRYPWWDDSEANGGAVIGDYLYCSKGDWDEFR